MAEPQDTNKYHFKIGNQVVYRGVTNDLNRREADHRLRWPKGHILKIGAKTTRSAALEWKQGKKGLLNGCPRLL